MSTALQPLGPAGAPQIAADLVTRMGLWDDPGHAERPRVVVAMIGSVDGRATVVTRKVVIKKPKKPKKGAKKRKSTAKKTPAGGTPAT